MELINRFFSDFSDEQVNQFQRLQQLYTDWNEKINVISRKDIDNFYERHVLHSLSIAASFNFFEGTQILDLGTGGGFPGIPLAIFRPDVEFTLVDSVGKKTKVAKEIALELGLDNVEVIHGRAEDIKSRSFDYVVTRAVARLDKLWNWSRPMIRKGAGSEEHYNGLICLKGGDLSEEISESQLRPIAIDIHGLFPLDYFREKFILFVKK